MKRTTVMGLSAAVAATMCSLGPRPSLAMVHTPTEIVVPMMAAVPIGTAAIITVQVEAIGSASVPTGTVSIWDRDIPSFAKWSSHTVALDGNGQATFRVTDQAPGVPFTVSGITAYYSPTKGSVFSSSTSPAMSLEMDKWKPVVTAQLGHSDGNGAAAPLNISVSGQNKVFPTGDLTISDATTSGTCTETLANALLTSGMGRVSATVDLPEGTNSLTVTYGGDAYYGSSTSTMPPAWISQAGWTQATCPDDWARVPDGAGTNSAGGADVPMQKFGFPRPYGQFNSKALANTAAGTFVVQLDWADIEPSQGQFDFSKADAEVAAAIAQGKQIALVLRFQAGLVLSGSSTNCQWNFKHAQLLPEWVANELGSQNSFCSGGTALTIPKYWGAGFLTLWTACVDAVAAHFAPDAAHIAYVRAPVGLGDEAEPLTGPDSKVTAGDRSHLMAWGYNSQLWEAWQEDMLSYYKQDFWYAPWVLYTINHQDSATSCNDPNPVIATQPEISTFATRPIPCSGRPVEVDVAEWAVDHGFGLAQNSLDWSWVWHNPAKANPPAGNVNTILAYAAHVAPRPFIELQPVEALTYWCNQAVPGGLPPCYKNKNAILDAEEDVAYAHAHGVSEIEWYEDDLTNAKLKPVINLWQELEASPASGRIPTVVTATPSTNSVAPGQTFQVTLTVRAPGISTFIPGGTVTLSDDITGKHLAVVEIAPNQGAVVVTVKAPTNSGHLNLSASFADTVMVGKTRDGTWLWMPSTSTNQRVEVGQST